jgi:hypothetical protein
MELVSVATQHPWNSLDPVVKDRFRSLNLVRKGLNAFKNVRWPSEVLSCQYVLHMPEKLEVQVCQVRTIWLMKHSSILLAFLLFFYGFLFSWFPLRLNIFVWFWFFCVSLLLFFRFASQIRMGIMNPTSHPLRSSLPFIIISRSLHCQFSHLGCPSLKCIDRAKLASALSGKNDFQQHLATKSKLWRLEDLREQQFLELDHLHLQLLVVLVGHRHLLLSDAASFFLADIFIDTNAHNFLIWMNSSCS